MRRNGLLANEYLHWRFRTLGLPLQICRNFLDEVASLIPQASRQRFTSKAGKELGEWIVIGKKPRHLDFPPFAPLNSKRDEFMAAIDKAISEIQKVVEK